MKIESLRLRDWRNIASAHLEKCGQFVVLHGNNGMGKSNILESLYVLCSLKSFRDHQPRNLVRKGMSGAQIEAGVISNYGTRKLVWGYNQKGRSIFLDGIPCKNLGSWFNIVRSVLFCPDQTEIVRGRPELRRNFLDRARFTASPAYLSLIRTYNKVLDQKKALLKNNDDGGQLDIWNEQLVTYGVRIAIQRQMILKELEGPFQEMHNFIAGKEKVSLRLTGISGTTPEKLRETFISTLKEKRSEEIRLRRALVGPHCDDIKILLDGAVAKKFASQGQTRSIVISLKLAEVEAARRRGDTPIFLLDDLSSELDRDRTQKLLRMLAERDNQIWITTTDPSYLGSLPMSLLSRWYVEDGVVKRN
ncbi:MAG: DNA replication and repair protein RecF [Myxococcota bacterium]|nr:DNA replication and repair protein RecF [Myxococcota bacterium]